MSICFFQEAQEFLAVETQKYSKSLSLVVSRVFGECNVHRSERLSRLEAGTSKMTFGITIEANAVLYVFFKLLLCHCSVLSVMRVSRTLNDSMSM
ncbi:hypothetical protein AYI70_g6898 [Smittium culicis]|uniref:Uncharacterized protein n=1 Tax=Smittium culicis TaxID=133412 RepID=A0A1R1XMX6_9FUNG|nr:hypothetical protein AYI70_g6898 [Smittium culicis]